MTLAEDSITIPGVSPEEFILHQVGSCFLGVSPELTEQQEKNKVGRVNPSSRQPPTHISGPGSFLFLASLPGMTSKQLITSFCCSRCRATIDEVETDVVEIEAKLDKVRRSSTVV